MITKDDILNKCHRDHIEQNGTASINPKNFPAAFSDAAKDAMDEWSKVMCLDLLDYLATKKVICMKDEKGEYFKVRGETLTREQIFENFL